VLKNDTAKLVQRAERGEHIVISRHGKPVATLGPPAVALMTSAQHAAEWERERAAFERMAPKLERKYRGRFVAVSGGKVVGTHADASTLFERVARAHPEQVFFIGRVGAPEPIVDMPGFSIE
jgi:antitoxin (DNA-binding transcriptional repressor) of toxin-antitoxin stability system